MAIARNDACEVIVDKNACPPRWCAAVRVVALAFIVAMVVFARVVAQQRSGQAGHPIDMAIAHAMPAAFLVPGVVLLLRRRWHPVGWLLCLLAVSFASSFSSDWSKVSFGGAWLYWYLNSFGDWLGWPLWVALLVVFPDGLAGRTRRQQRVGQAVLAVVVSAVLARVLATGWRDELGTLISSPLAIAFVPRAISDAVHDAALVVLLVAFVGMVRRYRASHDVVRRQYRWVLSAIALVLVCLLVGMAGSLLAGSDSGPWWYPILFAFFGVPIAFMVAILRYRLYEIDRLVSRTVTYSVVVVVLAGIYVVMVGGLAQLLPSNTDVAVAASTLTAAAVFRPLQRRVRRAVDRRFNRTRFDMDRELERFARRLRDETDLQVVESDLCAVVDRTLQPATVSVWTPR